MSITSHRRGLEIPGGGGGNGMVEYRGVKGSLTEDPGWGGYGSFLELHNINAAAQC